MSNAIVMFRIKEVEQRITIPCEFCLKKGIVDMKCPKCGGKGTHKKTIKIWKVMPRTELVLKINRASKDYSFAGRIIVSEGELRYWVSESDYFAESDRLLHFTYQDAEQECKRRNAEYTELLEILDNNHRKGFA